MALFEKKEAATVVTLSPEVAVCEQKIAELERSRAEKVTQIGQLFLQNNGPEQLAGTIYEEEVKALAELGCVLFNGREIGYHSGREINVLYKVR